MELENFIDPQANRPPKEPSPQAMATARRLLADFAASQRAAPTPFTDPDKPDPLFTEASLCAAYVRDHQPTIHAEGRFWRCPRPNRPWQPVTDDLIFREVYFTLQGHPSPGLRPSARRVAAVIELLRHHLNEFDPAYWDNPVGYFPFPTRLHAHHDLLEASEYTRGHCVATTFPYDYVYGATAPAWEAFLQSTLPHAAGFLQEFAGYCLLPDNHHELSLWLWGPPRSGKSTCLHGLQTLLGPFAGALSLPALATRQLDPAFLRRKHLLVCHEPPASQAALDFLSSLVSGESLTLARHYRPPVTVQSSARLALSFHTLPSAEARFQSLYHRAALVVFDPLPPGQHDPHLKDRIAQEGPGLFNWALAGLRRLLQRGRFDPPATMLAAAQRLLFTATSPAAFVEACCLPDPNARTPGARLKQVYDAWCRQNGLEPVNANLLADEWRRQGFERHRIQGRSHWFGVALRPAVEPSLLSDQAAAALPAPASPPAEPAQP